MLISLSSLEGVLPNLGIEGELARRDPLSNYVIYIDELIASNAQNEELHQRTMDIVIEETLHCTT